MHVKKLVVSATLLAVMAIPAAAWDKSGPDVSDKINAGRIDPHVRYPGDKAYAFGTVNENNGKKTPYVERCTWSFSSGPFGLPSKLKQTCRRYTNENTR